MKKGLSAGRVQSIAVKLIIDRENEIKAFVPEEYWTLEGQFKKEKKLSRPITMVQQQESRFRKRRL